MSALQQFLSSRERFQIEAHAEAWERVQMLLTGPDMIQTMRNLGKALAKAPNARSIEVVLKDINAGGHVANASLVVKILHAAGLISHTMHGRAGVCITIHWAPLTKALKDL